MTCANNHFRKKTLATALGCLLLGACASNIETADDPLKHSRKLISEGHSSLYDNGAFAVPQTQIKLIPAGESAWTVAGELAGVRARQAFLTSVKNAADSVYLIPSGTELSLEYAKGLHQGAGDIGEQITDVTRSGGRYLIKRSAVVGKDMVVESWQFGKDTAAAMNAYGIALEDAALQGGGQLANTLTEAGHSTMKKSWAASGALASQSTQSSKETFQFASSRFVQGYVAVPEKLATRGQNISEAANTENFQSGWHQSLTFREEHSRTMTDLMGDTTRSYVSDVSSSFKNASRALNENLDETGVGLGLLKASRWVLQGVLWDGLIEPVSKFTAASLGYVSVNLVAFPVMVVVNEGKASTQLAVEVTWNAAGSVYDVIAPSATAAVASVYGLLKITGGHLAAGATAAGGSVLGAGEIATGQIAGKSVQGVGYVSGKTVQYIGVPLAAAGVTLGSGTVGVVAGGAGALTGSTVMITGEVAALGTQATGTVLGGTTLVAGTTASVIAGTSVGVYELSKAVIVPAGYELGGGIVLGYGTTSQLAAHSVLAVADASYLVLSLEGPRWVIYAVKGNLGNGDELQPGTLLDLEAMQENGEQFEYLPVSDEEMQAVIDNLYRELPEARQQ